ncbi:MAG: hypothetical protein QM760_15665 [Nibricoccus sp.]
MLKIFRPLIDTFVSIKLTVALLAIAIILVFAATLDQVNLGVWVFSKSGFAPLWFIRTCMAS